jgi:hypothetical protein
MDDIRSLRSALSQLTAVAQDSDRSILECRRILEELKGIFVTLSGEDTAGQSIQLFPRIESLISASNFEFFQAK